MSDDARLTELSLFSGIGGGCLASRALGIRTLGYVEWEAYPQEVLKARIADGSLDAAPVFSDVRRFVAEGWAGRYRGRVDLVTAGFPCFAAGTLVLSRCGYEPIEGLRVGDEVLTHLGRWRRITSIMRREGVSLWRISAQGSPGIITTTEHPFYAREQGRLWRNVDRNYDRVFSDPGWRPAKELGGLFAAQVLPDEVRSDLSLDFWWLVGRYLADGWRVKRKGRKNGRVVICCASHEAGELAARIARAGFTASRCAERTVVKFHITKGSFYEFLQPFGAYAHGKTLPGFVYELPAEPARSLLDGYLSGDGYQDSGFKAATTVSKRLALGVALLAQRAYGVVASVTTNGKPATCVIEGRTVNQRPCHIVVIPDRNRSAFVDGKYGWKLVRKSGPVGLTGTVHNISVDGDESYVAEGCVVHNCQPFSVAGKQLGSADERNMWPATAAVLRDVRPSFVFLENVPGLLSNPYWKTIRGNLAALGYDAEWGCLSAADVGAPHRRNRVWIFAWLRNLPDAERDRVRVIAERYQRSKRGKSETVSRNAEPGDDGAAG